MSFKEKAIAALEELKGHGDIVTASTIVICQEAIRRLPEDDGWISVKKRLPEDLPENSGKKVIPCLVSLKSCYPNGKPNTQKRQRQLIYYGPDDWRWEWSRIGASRVTHWMPLPEPPKEVG